MISDIRPTQCILGHSQWWAKGFVLLEKQVCGLKGSKEILLGGQKIMQLSWTEGCCFQRRPEYFLFSPPKYPLQPTCKSSTQMILMAQALEADGPNLNSGLTTYSCVTLDKFLTSLCLCFLFWRKKEKRIEKKKSLYFSP